MSLTPPGPSYILRGSDDGVSCIRAAHSDPLSNLLLSGTYAGTINIWDLKSMRVKHSFKELHGNKSVVWLQDLAHHSCMLSQGRDEVINCIKLDSNYCVEKVQTISYPGFCSAVWMEEEECLAIPNRKSTLGISLIDIHNNHETSFIPIPEKFGMIMTLNYVPCRGELSNMLICGYEDGSVSVIDVKMCRDVFSSKIVPEAVLSVAFDVERGKGVVGSADDVLKTFQLCNEGMSLAESGQVSVTNKGVASLCLRGDNKICASGGWDHRVRLFTWPKMRPLAILRQHTDTVNSLSFSKQNFLFSASADKTICMWELYRE